MKDNIENLKKQIAELKSEKTQIEISIYLLENNLIGSTGLQTLLKLIYPEYIKLYSKKKLREKSFEYFQVVDLLFKNEI